MRREGESAQPATDHAARRRQAVARRVAARVAALAFALAGMAIGAIPARAASGPEYFGINIQTLGSVTPDQRQSVLRHLNAGGLTLARVEVRWDVVEREAPTGTQHTYDWSSADDQIALLTAAGLRPVPLFRYTPSWVQIPDAAKPRGVDELPSARHADFAAMVAAFARRYGDGGTFWRERPALPQLVVRSYEIWNEVNLGEYAWNGVPDPEAYSALLRAIRPTLKAAQPAGVLLASLAYHDNEAPDYIARMGRAGGLAAIDAMGYHPYAPEAPETIGLVRRLRAQLTAAGAPALPIYANEAGQEAVVQNPDGSTAPARAPSEWAWQQFPSDAARAANLAFAGEALAASDCGVEQFLPYSVSGTERDGEKLTEAYMGLFRPATGAPTLTAEALFRASARWRARFAAGGGGVGERLALCGGGQSPPSALLPIQTTFTGTQLGCVRVRATYDGNPLEGATLSLTAVTGDGTASQLTNGAGEAVACLGSGSADHFRASVQLSGAGQGGSVACDVRGAGCPVGVGLDAAPGTTVSAAQVSGLPSVLSEIVPAAPPACAWSSTTRQIRFVGRRGRTPARATLAAKVRCSTARKGQTYRFAVHVRERGRARSRKIRTVTVKVGYERRFTIRGGLRAGRPIVVTYTPVAQDGIPPLRDRVTLRLPGRSR
jgi:hypothetical protein